MSAVIISISILILLAFGYLGARLIWWTLFLTIVVVGFGALRQQVLDALVAAGGGFGDPHLYAGVVRITQ